VIPAHFPCGAAPASVDPYWANVTALWKMEPWTDATHVPDYGPNSITLTLTGANGYSTDQGKFHPGSYKPSTSATNQGYLSASHVSAFAFPGDFVIDGWIYIVSNAGMTAQVIGDNRPTNSAFNAWILYVTPAGNLTWYSNNAVRAAAAGGEVGTGGWYYYAVSRTSGNTELYVGTSGTAARVAGPSADATSPASSTIVVGNLADVGFAGHNLWGFMQETRITIGSNRGFTGASIAVPTATFPTS